MINVMHEDAEIGERIRKLRSELALGDLQGRAPTPRELAQVEALYNQALNDVWRMVGATGDRRDALLVHAVFHPESRRVEMHGEHFTWQGEQFAGQFDRIIYEQENTSAAQR